MQNEINLESFFDDPLNIQAILATLIRAKQASQDSNVIFHPTVAQFAFALRKKFEQHLADGHYKGMEYSKKNSYSLDQSSPVLSVIEERLLAVVKSYGDRRDILLYGRSTEDIIATYFAPFTIDDESMASIVSKIDALRFN